MIIVKKVFLWGAGIIFSLALVIGALFLDFNSPAKVCKYYESGAARRGCFAFDGTVISVVEHPDVHLTVKYLNDFETGPIWYGDQKQIDGRVQFSVFVWSLPQVLHVSNDNTLYTAIYTISDSSTGKDTIYLGLLSLEESSRGPLVLKNAVALGSELSGDIFSVHLIKESDSSIDVVYSVPNRVQGEKINGPANINTSTVEIFGERLQKVR